MPLCNICSPDGQGVDPAQCQLKQLPRDIVDLATPLYQASGGRLYRLHVTTDARYVSMGEGITVEAKLNALERSLATNSRVYFQDNIAGRNGLTGLTAGDMCFVKDASGDPNVQKGPAMYMWIDTRSWQLFYKSLSPLDAINLIQSGGGLAVDDAGKVYVDFSKAPKTLITTVINQIISGGDGDGLTINTSTGKLMVSAAELAGSGLEATTANKLKINPAPSGGLSLDSDGVLIKLHPNGGLHTNSSGLAITPDPAHCLTVSTSGIGMRLKSGGGLTLYDYVGSSGFAVKQLAVKPDDLFATGSGLKADSAGKLAVDFSTMPDSQVVNLVKNMVKPKGGLAFDPTSGQMYVDFSRMDDGTKNAIKASIRVPIWLTKDTSFYVGGPGAADPPANSGYIEGKGVADSEGNVASPFKTVQACIDYICDNFNLSTKNAHVVIAPGVYNEVLVFGGYSTSSGQIIVKKGAGAGDVTLLRNGYSSYQQGHAAVNINGDYTFQNIQFKMAPVLTFTASTSSTLTPVVVYGSATFNGCRFTVDLSGAAYADNSIKVNVCCCMVRGGAILGTHSSNTIMEIIPGNSPNPKYKRILVVTGSLTINGRSQADDKTSILVRAGDIDTFCEVDGGTFKANLLNHQTFVMDGGYTASGQGYWAHNGGTINTSGVRQILNGKSTYFPYNTASSETNAPGSAESETFSWYK